MCEQINIGISNSRVITFNCFLYSLHIGDICVNWCFDHLIKTRYIPGKAKQRFHPLHFCIKIFTTDIDINHQPTHYISYNIVHWTIDIQIVNVWRRNDKKRQEAPVFARQWSCRKFRTPNMKCLFLDFDFNERSDPSHNIDRHQFRICYACLEHQPLLNASSN